MPLPNDLHFTYFGLVLDTYLDSVGAKVAIIALVSALRVLINGLRYIPWLKSRSSTGSSETSSSSTTNICDT